MLIYTPSLKKIKTTKKYKLPLFPVRIYLFNILSIWRYKL